MIDEKMLLEERTEWPNPIGKEEYHKGWNECNKYWCNTIKSQPKVGEWIPVSEGLPEEAESVLLTVKDNKLIHDNLVMIGCYTYEQGWILNGYIDLVDLNVIAWIPLPEPYKEQNDAI